MTSPKAHARFAPSSMQRRIACPGSLALEEAAIAKPSSKFADEGTAAHHIAALTLDGGENTPRQFLGRTILVHNGVVVDKAPAEMAVADTLHEFEVDDEMCAHVQTYIDNVVDITGGAPFWHEKRVNFHYYVPFAGVDDCFGTSDLFCIAAQGEELQVHDLKYGKGVQVYAANNEQMMTYALGVLRELTDAQRNQIKIVRLVIHQPRLDFLDEWTCAAPELMAFAKKMENAVYESVRQADAYALGEEVKLSPGTKQCQFCKAKGTCPAARGKALAALDDMFEDLTEPAEIAAAFKKFDPKAEKTAEMLDALYPNIDFVYDWASAVLAAIEARLLSGETLKNAKLVKGKKGRRAWSDKEAAEAKLKAMRLRDDEMYDMKLISPTVCEEKFKKDHPRRWTALQDLITQSEGRPSVAPVEDKREALVIKPVADDFADETCADLL